MLPRRRSLDWTMLITGVGAVGALLALALAPRDPADEAAHQPHGKAVEELQQSLVVVRMELLELTRLANSLFSLQLHRMDELEASLAALAAKAPAAQAEQLTLLKVELKAVEVELRAAVQQRQPVHDPCPPSAMEHRLPAVAFGTPRSTQGEGVNSVLAHDMSINRLKAGDEEDTSVDASAGSQLVASVAAAPGSSSYGAFRRPLELQDGGGGGGAAASGPGNGRNAWSSGCDAAVGPGATPNGSPSPIADVSTPAGRKLSASATTFTPASTLSSGAAAAPSPSGPRSGGVSVGGDARSYPSAVGVAATSLPSLTEVMRLMSEGKQGDLPHMGCVDDTPLASPASASTLRPQAKPWERPFLSAAPGNATRPFSGAATVAAAAAAGEEVDEEEARIEEVQVGNGR